MTIPTREEALEDVQEMLSSASEEYYGDASDAAARLRSYIESHTGEPVAWQYLLENGRWSNMPGDWTPDEDALGRYTYRPLFASPIQPDHIADVGKMICPRSANGRPESFTVRECVAAGECGCGESVTPGSTVRASPVQPVKLEWVGTDGNNLSYNGKVIAAIDYSKNHGGFYVMTWLDEHFRKSLTCATYGPLEEARAALESTARQWLSGGDE